MPPSPTGRPDLPALHGANVRRLMARLNMTQSDVVRATGLDERTVRSMLRGVTRPQARTLHKLAEGLGVDTDELFQDPYHTGSWQSGSWQPGSWQSGSWQSGSWQSGGRQSGGWQLDGSQSGEQASFDLNAFDRATNPIAAEMVDAHPELFENWAAADFSELFSRMAVGGELTEAGTLATAHAMNDRRELMHQVAVILESSEADLMRDFVKLLFDRATTLDRSEKSCS